MERGASVPKEDNQADLLRVGLGALVRSLGVGRNVLFLLDDGKN